MVAGVLAIWLGIPAGVLAVCSAIALGVERGLKK